MRYFSHIVAATLLFALCSCAKSGPELPSVSEEGRLAISLSEIGVQTKSTPAELGVPFAAQFTLQILNSAGREVSSGLLHEEDYPLAPDTYTLVASFGDNPAIGVDDPYYVGSASATVVKGQTTPVSIACYVGNALVSASFGEDAAGRARFEKYYSDYSVRVALAGDHRSVSIPGSSPSRSVYVSAGSSVELYFEGTLKADGSKVSMPIELPSGVSNTLAAADHLKLRLEIVPGAVLDVTTIVETVTISQTIPFKCLPAPTATTTHRYDAAGELVGTDLAFSQASGIVGAELHQGSADGPVVRQLSGTGALSSAYTSSSDWPFLPAGTYVAVFHYDEPDGLVDNDTKTRSFTIPEPTLSFTYGGYTSYTKYQEGNVDAANACERLTVYAPWAEVSVSEDLISNPNYSLTLSASFRGGTPASSTGAKRVTLPNQGGTPVSATPYSLDAQAIFCGQRVSGSGGSFRITGLPVTFAPPKEAEWSHSGGVKFNDSNVKLSIGGGAASITNNSSVNIPAGTKVAMKYDIIIHPGAMHTTFSVSLGSQEIYKQYQKGGFLNTKDYSFKGTTSGTVLSSATSKIVCNNDYGLGATHSTINSLEFKYSR